MSEQLSAFAGEKLDLPDLGVHGQEVLIGEERVTPQEARAFAKRIVQYAKLAEGKNVREA